MWILTGIEDLAKEEEFKLNLEIARLSGAVWLRDRLRWGWVEPTEGKWTWSVFDNHVQQVVKAGLRLLPAVEGNASWSEESVAGTVKNGLGPPREDAWRALWGNLASRFAGKITHWQVWNEPNPAGIAGSRYPGGITAEKFRDHFLKPAWEAAKAANPDVKIVLGGSAGIDMPWTQALYAAESWRWFDVFDWHPYATTPRAYRTQALALLPLFESAGRAGTPVWGSEFEVKTPDNLAQWYVTIMALRDKVNMGPHFIFDLKDWPGEGPYSYKMGLVREDGTPKDKLAAFNIGAALLDRAKFAGSLNLGEDIVADRFSRPSGVHDKIWLEDPPRSKPLQAGTKKAVDAAAAGPLTVIWNEGRERVVSLRVGQPSVTVTGAAGPMCAMEALGNVLTMTLPPNKVFYIQSRQSAQAAEPLVGIQPDFIAAPAPLLLVTVNNVFEDPLEGALALHLPEGWKVEPASRPIDLPRAGSGQSSFTLTLPADLAIEPVKTRLVLTTPYGTQTLDRTIEVKAPLALAIRPERGSDGKLTRLVTTVKGAPGANAKLTWKSPNPVFTLSGTLPAAGGELTLDLPAGTAFPEGERVPLLAQIQMEGLSYHETHWLDIGLLLDIDHYAQPANQDVDLTLFYAQPFRPAAATLSAVEIPTNNWTSNPYPLTIKITETTPDGKVLGTATASVPPVSNNVMFRFSPLLTGLTPGNLYWIVTANVQPNIRWVGHNPWVGETFGVRTQQSNEGAAWHDFSFQDFVGLQYSFRTYR